MGATATFDMEVWVARYPEFQNVAPGVAQGYFDEACLYHANDGSGPVRSSATQRVLLNMVTAHICKINTPDQSGSPTGLVGRISSASQGSVSVGVENQYPPGSPQWYQQTIYGAAYWAATSAYRTARYAANPGRSFNYPFIR